MATDFITFNEGADYVLASGMPATCHFLLSTDNIAAFSPTNTLAGGVGEITGTGYGRQSQALPTPVGGDITWAASTWNTGSATDWPSAVRSMVLATTADNSGKAICAWNLIPGGGARNLSTASTTESVTPTLNTESVDVSFASTVASAAVGGGPGYTPTLGVAAILPTVTALEDVGSNLFNNGSYEIYLVPSTGVYEITAQFNFGINLTGGTQVRWLYGYSVGSASAGTAAVGNGNEDDIVVPATGSVYDFTRTFKAYASLTAGQYVNLSYEFINGTASGIAAFNPFNGDTSLMVQRIA